MPKNSQSIRINNQWYNYAGNQILHPPYYTLTATITCHAEARKHKYNTVTVERTVGQNPGTRWFSRSG